MRKTIDDYNPVFDFLQFGRENAKTKQDIIDYIGFKSERQMRQEIARERLLNKRPIIATNDGRYYNSYDPIDLKPCIKSLKQQGIANIEIARALESICPNCPTNDQEDRQMDIYEYLASLESDDQDT